MKANDHSTRNKGMNHLIANGFSPVEINGIFATLKRGVDGKVDYVTIDLAGVVRHKELGRYNDADQFLRDYYGS